MLLLSTYNLGNCIAGHYVTIVSDAPIVEMRNAWKQANLDNDSQIDSYLEIDEDEDEKHEEVKDNILESLHRILKDQDYKSFEIIEDDGFEIIQE